MESMFYTSNLWKGHIKFNRRSIKLSKGWRFENIIFFLEGKKQKKNIQHFSIIVKVPRTLFSDHLIMYQMKIVVQEKSPLTSYGYSKTEYI